MGVNKVTDELVSTVRSIVGSEYSDMDLIRALHMAKNDPTAAINIIFDTPSSRRPEISKNPEPLNRNLNPEPRNAVSDSKAGGNDENVVKLRNLNSGSSGVGNSRKTEDRGEEEKSEDAKDLSSSSSSMGSEWWFVGHGEVTGLSTCKGWRLNEGEEVIFTFPKERKLNSPSSGKFGGGRGRQVAVCSEIVIFSTRAPGDVL